MNKFNYDSYCGIFCGACDIMMSYKTKKKTKLGSFWSEAMVKTLHTGLGLADDAGKPYELKCHGCKSGQLFINCEACNIRKCAIARKADHCIDCGDYPCALLTEMQKIRFLLPHLNANGANMETIKKIGTAAWLSEQEARWKCPGCGSDFSWYMSKCTGCGGSLKKRTYKFSYLKSLLLKFGIFLSSRKTAVPRTAPR